MGKAGLLIPGILVTFILLLIITSSAATILFNQKTKKEVGVLFANTQNKNDIVQHTDLSGLPGSVQKWLERSQVIGKERIRTVRLRQKGLMRLAEDKPWMEAAAEQYFTVDEPGFIWKAKIKMAPLLYLTGLDKYYEGKGHMLVKVLSLYPVANSQGKEMDQGTLLRYLAELPWFPTAALNSYIKWEEIDAHSARATMSYKEVTASGIFTFDQNGDLAGFAARRYRELKGKYVLQDWGGISKEFKEFGGIRIPTKTDVIWKSETGDFNWYKCEIEHIEYNKPVIYQTS